MMDTLPNSGITIVEQPQTGLKQPLRVIHEKTVASEDAALLREEERLIDEEITSEEETEDADKMERNLVTVALVKSVVETRGGNKTQKVPAPVSPRYGLRKRRRSTGTDLIAVDKIQGTNNGCLALTHSRSRLDKSRSSYPEPVPNLPQSSIVPNPLASVPDDAKPEVPAKTSSSSFLDATLVVPFPLPAAASAPEKTEKTPEPPDPSFSADKRKVTISEPTRSRGFSIDLDYVGLDFPEDATNTELSLSSSTGGRGRAFSFECFAFGINADEPLPPLQDSSDLLTGRPRQDSLILLDHDHPGHPTRMRGDSIIFDPSSFQDGGIHEQNALEKATSPESEDPILPSEPGETKPDSATSCSPPLTSKAHFSSTAAKPIPPVTLSSSSPPTLPAVTSYTATTTTTTNSNTTTTVTITASSNTASISMELLNKDGRIGIYLPEARKARIARFHAKRARRIWRKRIKYDCRKKLADSRPRIKGRFVKRSDMEEE